MWVKKTPVLLLTLSGSNVETVTTSTSYVPAPCYPFSAALQLEEVFYGDDRENMRI